MNRRGFFGVLAGLFGAAAVPRTPPMAQRFGKPVIPPPGIKFSSSTHALIRENGVARIVTIDEVRALQGLPPADWSDTPLVAPTLTPLGKG